MKVNFSAGQPWMNVHRINQSTAAKNNNADSVKFPEAKRSDNVTISPQAKVNGLLESLMKQKALITEQKNSLVASTLEKGGTLDTIQSQLEAYDEQMRNIDDQIAKTMAREMEKQTEKLKKQGDNKPKTEEEIQNERLAHITNLSGDLQQAKTIRSVQARLDGDARVLKSEIKLDKARAGSSEGAKELISQKETALTEMKQKSLDLTSKITDKLSDVSEKTDEIHKPQEILPDDEAQKKTDELDSTAKLSPDDTENKNSQKTLVEKDV